MPVAKRSFLFRHFEKIVCGVVVLLILGAVAFAALRAGAAQRELPVADIRGAIDTVEKKLQATPAPLAKDDWLAKLQDRLQKFGTPQALRSYLFFWAPPVRYAETKVAPGKEFTLRFSAPLEEGSVQVEGGTGLVELVEHPVGDDFTQVKLRSGQYEGSADVVGIAGKVRHVYPVVVNEQAGKTANPPAKVTLTVAVDGVSLRIAPNPANDQDQVKIVSYEVWRRDWEDPLGDYRKISTIGSGLQVQTRSSSASRPAGVAGRPGGMWAMGAMGTMGGPTDMGSPYDQTMGPGGPGMEPMGPTGVPTRPGPGGTPAQAEKATTWTDASVSPGQRYSYKVRSVGDNTFPRESDFASPVEAEVPPKVDFKFSRSSLAWVSFDVGKLLSTGRLFVKDFQTAIGDEIGGVEAKEELFTGATLIDFHRGVMRTEDGRRTPSDRAIYADADGNLHMLWRNELKSELWKTPVGMPAGRGREAERGGMRGGLFR